MKVFCMTSLGGWLAHIMLPTHFKSPEEMSLCEAAFNANHSETLKTHDLEPLVCKRTQCRAPLWNTQSYISLNESKPLLFDNCAKPYHDYSFIWINRASVVARSVAQMLRYESCNKAKYLAWVLFFIFLYLTLSTNNINNDHCLRKRH